MTFKNFINYNYILKPKKKLLVYGKIFSLIFKRNIYMKLSLKSIRNRFNKILRPHFEEQQLTSFSGIVIFQSLFTKLNLKKRLSSCFRHLSGSEGYSHGIISQLLLIHLLIGFRRLSDVKYYANDPMILRALSLNSSPSVATISRMLNKQDEVSVRNIKDLSKELVLDRLSMENLTRITLDYDGTVQSTGRHAEGTAVGFNKKKKGARSYYPLLCTVSQTGQVLDIHHRPGNVHDSNGAREFIESCVNTMKNTTPKAKIEARTDSAFFDEKIVTELEHLGVEFTISVPFARFTNLKKLIESRKRWAKFDNEISYFESEWKPDSWDDKYRFLFIRTKTKKQQKGPIQLDLFEPYEYGYEFKVIVTNKLGKMKNILRFHNGRGCQEGFIGELKSDCQFDYVPVRKKAGNQVFMYSAIMAHNLNRELQMVADEKQKRLTEKRNSLWTFKKLNTIRQRIIKCAGRLTKPQGKLKLTMNKNDGVEQELLKFLDALEIPL